MIIDFIMTYVVSILPKWLWTETDVPVINSSLLDETKLVTAKVDADSPQRCDTAHIPVKNTFIHFGTPSRNVTS